MSVSRIVCWNVNGLRSLYNKIVSFKGSLKALFDEWNADILAFQESKVGSKMNEIDPNLLHVEGYESFWSLSKRPGYSGVVTYVRKGMTGDAKVAFDMKEFDQEGRIVMTDHSSFILFNVYFPNSGSGEERFEYKMRFYKWFEGMIDQLIASGRNVIIAGDVNTTHTPLDIWNPQELENGLYKEERKWMDHMFFRTGDESKQLVDTFRYFHPEDRKYTWWDVKLNHRILDKGLRIDYFLVNRGFLGEIINSEMFTQQLGSDHCPILLEMKPQLVSKCSPPALSSDKIKSVQKTIHSFFGKSNSQPSASTSTSTSTTFGANDTSSKTFDDQVSKDQQEHDPLPEAVNRDKRSATENGSDLSSFNDTETARKRHKSSEDENTELIN